MTGASCGPGNPGTGIGASPGICPEVIPCRSTRLALASSITWLTSSLYNSNMRNRFFWVSTYSKERTWNWGTSYILFVSGAESKLVKDRLSYFSNFDECLVISSWWSRLKCWHWKRERKEQRVTLTEGSMPAGRLSKDGASGAARNTPPIKQAKTAAVSRCIVRTSKCGFSMGWIVRRCLLTSKCPSKIGFHSRFVPIFAFSLASLHGRFTGLYPRIHPPNCVGHP